MLRDKRNNIFSHNHLIHRSTTNTTRAGQDHDWRMAIPPRPSRSHVKGILRRRPLYGRPPRLKRKKSLDLVDRLQYFWKFVTLILIPVVGYLLSRLYLSAMICHFLALCFIYRVVDLMDHNPALCALPSPRNSPKGQEQSFRSRLVSFAEGTKFHRLPKPMTRKQKQLQVEHKVLPTEIPDMSSSLGRGNFTMTTHVDERTPSKEVTTATLDWEATNRLLKSLIHKHHDETVSHENSDENEVFAWSRNDCAKRAHSSCNKLSRSDPSITRDALAERPLQRFSNIS